MSENKEESIKALEARLYAFVQIVLDEASRNPEFSHQLEGVLLGDTVKVVHVEPSKKKIKESLDVVGFLHEHGENKLREALSTKADNELKTIVRAEGIRKGKELKALERHQMIEEILQTAARRLGQGKSFLQ